MSQLPSLALRKWPSKKWLKLCKKGSLTQPPHTPNKHPAKNALLALFSFIHHVTSDVTVMHKIVFKSTDSEFRGELGPLQGEGISLLGVGALLARV